MAYKLIVADASPSVQKAVQLAFSAPDWEILSFDNGLELTKAIFESHPDAILVSLTLPGMDGYAVGRFVRKQEEFNQTVLVFLKGAFETFDPQRAEGVDYDEIVAKPFDSVKLAVRMKNLVDAKGDHSGFPESPIPAESVRRPAPARAPEAPAPKPPAPAETTSEALGSTGFTATPSSSRSAKGAPATAPAPAPSSSSVSASAAAPSSAPQPPSASPSALLSAAELEDLEHRLQEWLRRELVGMEREVEKRVRSQIALELKRWFAEHYISLPSKGK